MPCAVACPACGVDATHAASQQLQAQVGTSAPAFPQKDHNKWLMIGLCVAVLILCGLIGGLYVWANFHRDSKPAEPQPVASTPVIQTVPEAAGAQPSRSEPPVQPSPAVSAPTPDPIPTTPSKPAPTMRDPSYVAVGALFDRNLKTGNVEITRIIAGSPAKKARIVVGDILVKVDDKSIQEMRLKDIADMFYGPIGSKLSLDFVNAKTGKPKHVELVRQKYSR